MSWWRCTISIVPTLTILKIAEGAQPLKKDGKKYTGDYIHEK
jgi:hypothetical protein